jgi:hypothetical protein
MIAQASGESGTKVIALALISGKHIPMQSQNNFENSINAVDTTANMYARCVVICLRCAAANSSGATQETTMKLKKRRGALRPGLSFLGGLQTERREAITRLNTAMKTLNAIDGVSRFEWALEELVIAHLTCKDAQKTIRMFDRYLR